MGDGLNPVFTMLAKIAGPGIVGGVITKWLENMDAAAVYQMAIENKGKNAWEVIPAEYKEKLKNYQEKTGILDNLSVEWLVNELAIGHREDLASLILNSPDVEEFARKIISDLQKGSKTSLPNR
jgi:hypothetical protein